MQYRRTRIWPNGRARFSATWWTRSCPRASRWVRAPCRSFCRCAVARLDPQRHGRSGGHGPALCAPYQRRAGTDGKGPKAVRRRHARNRRVGAAERAAHRSTRHRHRPRYGRRADPGDDDASGLSRCAGLLVAAKQDTVLKHVEFVSVGAGQGIGSDRDRGRPGREPAYRYADGSSCLRPHPGGQLSQCAALRAYARRRARHDHYGTGKRARRTRRADRQDRGGGTCHLGRSCRRARESADRARRVAPARNHGSAERPRAHPHPVRRHRTQERSDPAFRAGQRRPWCAHLHRLGE